MFVDSCPLTHIAGCDQCSWRTHAPTRATAYRKLAQHFKNAHGDMHAAYKARTRMTHQKDYVPTRKNREKNE